MDEDSISRLEDLERRVGALEVVTLAVNQAQPTPVPDLRQLDELRHERARGMSAEACAEP